MRVLTLLVFVLFSSGAATAQAPEATYPADLVAQVKATIQTLFDGMRAGDSTMVRSTFHPTMTLNSVVLGPDGESYRMMPGDPEAFVKAVGTPHDQVWDERVGEIDVRVDAGLATAWMAYRFYAGDTFSHCGVNAVQLAKLDGRWQIMNLMDTRRTGCE